MPDTSTSHPPKPLRVLAIGPDGVRRRDRLVGDPAVPVSIADWSAAVATARARRADVVMVAAPIADALGLVGLLREARPDARTLVRPPRAEGDLVERALRGGIDAVLREQDDEAVASAVHGALHGRPERPGRLGRLLARP